MKKILILTSIFSIFAAQKSFASHPHQAICVVNGTYPDQNSIQFLLQTHSEREYVTGNPNTDVHDYKYQVRVCDDDNDSGSCSTYESKDVSHGPNDVVTLVGMKDKTKVFFEGKFTKEGKMEGKIIQDVYENNTSTKKLVPFSVKLTNCIGQTWVKLEAEADSNAY